MEAEPKKYKPLDSNQYIQTIFQHYMIDMAGNWNNIFNTSQEMFKETFEINQKIFQAINTQLWVDSMNNMWSIFKKEV